MDYMGLIITAITTIAILFLTLFTKVIISVFKLGSSYKANFITKSEFTELKKELSVFRSEIKEDMKSWRAELERTVMSSSKAIMDRELKRIAIIDEKMDKFNDSYISFTATSEWMKDRYSELNTISDELLSLKKRVGKIEFDDDNITSRRVLK